MRKARSGKGRNSISIAAIGIVTTIAISSTGAFADTWQIDPTHSLVEFSVRHMMISNVKGVFEKVGGTITTTGNDPNSAKMEITIDANSLNTRVAMRDKDLKSANFLDVEKYPTIAFKSKKVEPAGEGKWKVTGDLTLHGVTKEVVLNIAGPTPVIKDPWGNTRAGASATTTINRQDFGMTFNKMLETGGAVVANEVAVSIEVEAVKK